MCYNKESSLIIYIFVVAAAIKMFLIKNIFYGVLLLAYGSMQLAEFIIWYGMSSPKLKNMNYLGSLLVGLLIAAQPLILRIASKDSIQQGSETLQNVNWAVIAIYTAIAIYIYLRNIKNSHVLSTVDKSSCRLSWNVLESSSSMLIGFATLLYLAGSIIVLYTTESYDIMGIFIGSFVASVIYSFGVGRSYSFGSLWCFTAILAAIVLGFFYND
jgi:hypothetical protein